MVLALFLLLAASPTFEESFRAGLLALQRNDLNAAADQSRGRREARAQQRPRLGGAGADLLEAEQRRQGGRRRGQGGHARRRRSAGPEQPRDLLLASRASR